MGCGSSQPITTSQTSLDDRPTTNNNAKSSGEVANGQLVRNGHATSTSANAVKGSPEKENQNGAQNKTDNARIPQSVAFEVKFENDIDNIISRNPPKRLKRLAPLDNVPKLSAEQLLEKQKQADEKRQQQLEAKKEASQKQSKLHRRLQQAKEFEKSQKQYTEMEVKQRSADLKRENQLKDKEAKRKIQTERAKRAREKARKLQNDDGIDEVDFEVEKDDYFNQEETDSWLDGDNNTMVTNLSSAASSRAWSGTDRVYSGKESPVKPYKPATINEEKSRTNNNTFQQSSSTTGPRQNDDFWD